MAVEVFAIVGSGTVEHARGILTPAQRGILTDGNGVRKGTQVMLANPEDLLSVDVWMASGVLVPSAAAVQVFGPHINTLPRTRKVILENVGGQDIYIAPTEAGATAADGFTLSASDTNARVELPLLHNNQIWALAASATSTLKIIAY
jgi:hypothetical protein